jgi:alpha-L-arabinofuranosidase
LRGPQWGSNRFGTDEFIQCCRVLGTEPYICVNMGTGTLDEAQAWVEYCNCTGDTYWANRRRENGHEEVEMALVELYRVTGEKRYPEGGALLR